MGSHKSRAEDHFSADAACWLHDITQDMVGLLAVRVHCWLMLSFSSTYQILLLWAALKRFSAQNLKVFLDVTFFPAFVLSSRSRILQLEFASCLYH